MASTLLPDPGPSYVISEPLPALARQEQPFEVYFTNEAYDEMIDKVRRKVFEGDRPVTVSISLEVLRVGNFIIRVIGHEDKNRWSPASDSIGSINE